MRLVNYHNLKESQGNLLLVYGPSGVGKTATILQTATDPITYLTAEGRKIKTTIVAIARPELRMKVGVYEGFNDLIETCYDLDKFKGSKTIFLDSMTHLMVIHLAQEILDENWAKKTEKEKDDIMKALTMQAKLSEESYGTMARQMNRLMGALQHLTMNGYDVICTARTADRPKWNRSLTCAPALMGKEFSKGMDGFFDFICILNQQEHPDNVKPPVPDDGMAAVWRYNAPLASFNTNEDYLAKWTGLMPPNGIINRKFHVQRTLDEANGIFKHDKEYFIKADNKQSAEKVETI